MLLTSKYNDMFMRNYLCPHCEFIFNIVMWELYADKHLDNSVPLRYDTTFDFNTGTGVYICPFCLRAVFAKGNGKLHKSP